MVRLFYISILIGLVNGGLKLYSYILTNSVSVLSDAVESTVNIVSAIMGVVAVRISEKPPDKSHPYGHGKIEYLASIIEVSLVICAMGMVVKEAIDRFINRSTLEDVTHGSIVLLVTIIVNLLLSIKLIKHGKNNNSPIFTSHGYHILGDVLTTCGVIIGIVVTKITGISIIDPILALVLATYVIIHVFKVLVDSVNYLIDAKIEDEKLNDIESIISNVIEEEDSNNVVSYHRLRSRRAGKRCFVDVHVTVPKDLTVEEAHRICEKIENRMREKHPDTDITIHIDPDKRED